MKKEHLDYLYEKRFEIIDIIDKLIKEENVVAPEIRETLFVINNIIEHYLKTH